MVNSKTSRWTLVKLNRALGKEIQEANLRTERSESQLGDAWRRIQQLEEESLFKHFTRLLTMETRWWK